MKVSISNISFNFKYMYDKVREVDLNMKIGPAVTNFSQVNTQSQFRALSSKTSKTCTFLTTKELRWWLSGVKFNFKVKWC